jgi:hypothetical protein
LFRVTETLVIGKRERCARDVTPLRLRIRDFVRLRIEIQIADANCVSNQSSRLDETRPRFAVVRLRHGPTVKVPIGEADKPLRIIINIDENVIADSFLLRRS